MSNNFIHLTEQQLSAITVEYCQMDIDGRHGIVVSEADMDRLLRELGCQVSTSAESSIPGIRIVSLGESAETTPEVETVTPATVTVKSWDGNRRDQFVRATESGFAKVCGQIGFKEAWLRVPHQKEVGMDRLVGEAFHILIWSTPKGVGATSSPPKRIFGRENFCHDAAYQPSGLGQTIVDPETGYAVAELVDRRALYIHFDACHHGYDDELYIFKKILESTSQLLCMSEDEWKKLQEEQLVTQRKRSKKAYVEECQKRMEKTIRGTTEAIAEKEREIPELQARLVRSIRELSGLKDKLAQLEQAKGDRVPAYEAEFESLMKVPGVLDVQAGNGVINVFTEHIYITPDKYPDETYDIGKFRMEINTSGRNGGLRFFNLTRKGGGGGHSGYNIHHPHVNSSGEPCLGNIKEMVATLIGEYEYSALTQVGLQYLKSVNLDDGAGAGIRSSWPKKEKGGDKC